MQGDPSLMLFGDTRSQEQALILTSAVWESASDLPDMPLTLQLDKKG